MNIFNVYVDCLDPDMPRLCLFAKREIKRGEQISFDYRQSTGNTDSKNTIKGSICSLLMTHLAEMATNTDVFCLQRMQT